MLSLKQEMQQTLQFQRLIKDAFSYLMEGITFHILIYDDQEAWLYVVN